MSVRWERVWLQPPTHLADQPLEPIPVQVLWAIEDECALEDQPVNWMLITSLPIERFEQAHQLLTWYSYRWLIELNQSQYPYKRDWEGGTWATPAVRIG